MVAPSDINGEIQDPFEQMLKKTGCADQLQEVQVYSFLNNILIQLSNFRSFNFGLKKIII